MLGRGREPLRRFFVVIVRMRGRLTGFSLVVGRYMSVIESGSGAVDGSG